MLRLILLLLVAGINVFGAEPRAADALAALLSEENRVGENVALLLRISKQYGDLVDDTKPESAAKGMAEKSMAYAKRAVALNPKNAKAHLSLAVSCGKLTDFVSNKQKLEYSKLIRDEALQAIALDPGDDESWHILGRWHFGIANVNPVLKSIASLIYGGLPAASNEEALKCLKKAQMLAPHRIKHRSELARIYTQLGKSELAAAEWKLVVSLPSTDTGDTEDKAEARAALDGK